MSLEAGVQCGIVLKSTTRQPRVPEMDDADDLVLVETPEEFARLFVSGWVVDGRDGGLVVGRRHSEGHIVMLQGTATPGRFALVGLMEGGEYLMSPEATANHLARLHEINSDNAPCDLSPQLTSDSRILNTRAEPHDKFLIVQEQFIVNINSTRRHFAELEELNGRYRFHYGRVLTDEEIAAMG